MSQSMASNPSDRIPVRVNPLLREIVPEFLNNARDDVQALRVALVQADYPTVARLGHSMKGSSSVGFDYLADLGLQLEDAANQGESNEIELLVRNLEDYLDRVEPI